MSSDAPELVSPSGKRAHDGANVDGASMPKKNRSAPGTAKPQSLEGNGERTVVYIDRPFNSKCLVISKFAKQHKFLTFGIASKILKQSIGTPLQYIQYFLTTALAEIPVDYLPLYLNKSEFNKLAPGSEVLEINISVVQRNALLSFQTNSSSTTLATLNQNKNGIYAIGLNKTCYGLNRRYTSFEATETMIPTSSSAPVYAATTETPAYEGLDEDFYGVDNTDATFDTSVPKHQVGMYTTLKNYFCLTSTNKYSGGWPLLQEKVVEYDAAAKVGEPILTYHYKPKVGLIKPPVKYLPTQLPYSVLDVPHGTQASAVEAYSVNLSTNNVAYTLSSRAPTVIADFSYYTPIEKSQYMFQGPGKTYAGVIQPSLHIGINPVPALTTGSIISGNTNSNFTDTRSYFDVHCEIVVGVMQYTDRPHATEYNCAFGENYYKGSTIPDTNSVPIGTLYPRNAVQK